jgi:hypothetical protein
MMFADGVCSISSSFFLVGGKSWGIIVVPENRIRRMAAVSDQVAFHSFFLRPAREVFFGFKSAISGAS